MRFMAIAAAFGLTCALACAPSALAQKSNPSTSAQIDYDGFRALTAQVETYRAGRLVSLEQFQTMARNGALILDARSADAYAAGHIEGAINLPLTDFTAPRLTQVLGEANRRILIYCNNNFSNNRTPVVLKRVELALNIQTFINLYGYGYRNVYELGEVVDFDDPAVRWVHS